MRRRIRLVVVLCSLCCPVGALANTSAALATAPTIASVSPNNGPAAGGTTVTITGTGFISGSTVKFGSSAATGVSIKSSTSITATSPAGSETVGVSVTNSNGTSTSTAYDQFGYDPAPTGAWLGLNGNSSTYLGTVGAFVEHSVVYDRSGPIEWEAGEPLEEGGKPTEGGKGLEADIDDGMIPVVTIEYKGYPGCEWGHECLPTGSAATTYVTGFVKSAEAILKAYPGKQILFEPINEPYGYGTAAQYANIVAKLLPEAEKDGIPLNDIYVAAYGKRWVPKMYEAQPKLETEIHGWYFHPYGPAKGTEDEDSAGIQSLPAVQAEMTSGQNNIIVSEVGYWTPDVNKGEEKGGPSSAWAENSTQAAVWLTEMLDNALPYHQAGWLRALLVYSRNSGGWAMQLPSDELTKQGEALEAFANSYGLGWWSIQSSPEPEGVLRLNSVSCTEASACTAVGTKGSDNEVSEARPIVERWNGSSWTLQSSTSPGDELDSLYGVSCVSLTWCMAVGEANYYNFYGEHIIEPWTETWNGTSWSLKSTPGSPETYLTGVSCSSSSFCIAVGSSTPEEPYNDGTSEWKPVVETWNGTKWTTQIITGPSGARSYEVRGVSCTSLTSCVAAGSYENSSGITKTLVEKWNGTEWAIQTSANPTGTSSSRLSGVSCTSSTTCIAVGNYESTSGATKTLAEKSNGTEWTIQTTPNPIEAKYSQLSAVSCVSTSICTATGSSKNSSEITDTLVEIWNGAEWNIQSSPNPSGARLSNLSGVSCSSPLACIAVGTHENVTDSGATTSTVIEHYSE